MPQGQDEEITVQQRRPQPVLSARTTVPIARLAAAQGEALRALWNHLRQQGARPIGPPFVRYHRFGDAETDVEVGVPVAEGATGEGPVAASELPGGKVISAWHLGSHDGLADTYARLQAWLQAHRYRPRGVGWEVYHWIDLSQELDPTAWPQPSSWRTQLVQPINRAT